MEGTTNINHAREIMGMNIIGPNELDKISGLIGIWGIDNFKENIPIVPFSKDFLNANKHEYILFLGVPFYKDGTPLTLVKMREFRGWNPIISEPCFYNQDWYLKEDFANQCTFKFQWYLVKKTLLDDTRGKDPQTFTFQMDSQRHFPSALLAAQLFFAHYILHPKNILWKNEYIWCSDYDHNHDQIYVGRYIDPDGVNKRGFSIHRHLKIRNNYGFVPVIS